MSGGDRIVVAGAGSIGCFVGGILAQAGRDIALLARERIADAIRASGLRLTDLSGLDATVPAEGVRPSVDPAVLAGATIVLVTVKSGATNAMADLIARYAPAEAIVISLQNGVGNADALRAGLPGRDVLAGMVPFNVVQLGPAHFHRGTTGSIVIEDAVPGLAARLSVPHLPVEVSRDMQGVLWGKLLMNLNNALNALSGLPLREQLQSRGWRRVLAAQIEEALGILRQAGTTPLSAGPLPPKLMPTVLRLPNFLFRMVAAQNLRIDPQARSSMWEDFERGRPTEVDQLQGAVVALAQRLGHDAPTNRRILALVRDAEKKGAGSPKLRPEDVQP